MIFRPLDETISRHIDYYWIVEDSNALFGASTSLHAYPGITPDMIIVLDGFYTYNYFGTKMKQSKSMLFSFIQRDIQLDLSSLRSFILIKFKSRALSSLQPFVEYSSKEIMENPVHFSDTAFDGSISQLHKRLKNFSETEIVPFLDDWFLSYYKKEREGFVVEMAEEICPDFNLQKIMEATNYSYSTIERYFKRETGLTPKKFQTLKRFKSAVTEICATKNNDWMKYVSDYKYYDHAHFIKDIKKHARITPNQLLETPSFLSFRPKV